MAMRISPSLILIVLAVAAGPTHAAIPLQINHQGVITVSSVPFDGAGQFRFALVDPDTGNNLWTNDGANVPGPGTPTAAVSLTVSGGVYSVSLGNTTLTNMTAIPSAIFNDDNVRLRVWFDDGFNGNQQLIPDTVLTSAPYAFNADTVDGFDGAALEESAEIDADITTHDTTTTAHANIQLDASNIITGQFANARIAQGPASGLDSDTVDGFDATALLSSGNAYPRGYIYGGVPSNDATDPTNDLSMTAVTCRDSGDTANIDAAAMVKRIDANWTAGNNGGGLDTGTAGGAAIYYIWAIDDSTGTNPGDFLFSLSSTTPTMPGGYDVKRVLGGRRWSGSAWDTFRTSGNGPVRWVQVLEPPQVYNDSLTGPSFHDVDCSAYLPAGLATRAQVPFAVDGDAEVHVRAVGTTAGPGVPTFFLDGSTADGDQAFAEVALDGSGVFQVTLTNGSGGESVVINLWAYEESL